MRVLLTGGGTGGHITPLLAVAQKLKAADPSIEIIYVGERGSKFGSMTEGQTNFDSQHQVFAGKLRRYNGESWFKRLLDVKTNFLNLRDMFYVLFGTVESWLLLRKLKPDVILLKGGFVGVPIGLAARNRFPIVTHDSDALPGLANRLVSKWAVVHATGMPASYYHYPKDKVQHVGVLVSQNYHQVTDKQRADYRKELNLPKDAPVLMITGGSLGSQSINKAIVGILPSLIQQIPDLQVIHQVGRGNEKVYKEYQNEQVAVYDLLPYSDLYKYSGAADVIVTRAGANTIAEFGIQAKACIIVPNPLLTGGHQLKNAEYLAKEGAAIIVHEEELGSRFETAITDLLSDPRKRQQLGHHLHDITPGDATEKLSQILIHVAQGSER